MKYINSTDWMNECQFICEEFNPIKWNKFFSPKIDTMIDYTEKLSEKID